MSNPNPNSEISPVFVYGTLKSPQLLAWLLTGDSTKSSRILGQRKPATLSGYTVRRVKHADFGALVKEETPTDAHVVHGFVVYPETRSERVKLDDFEGESYARTTVAVKLEEDGQMVEADAYLWAGETELLESADEQWSFETFEKERLEDWLDIFCGMEMVGEDGI